MFTLSNTWVSIGVHIISIGIHIINIGRVSYNIIPVFSFCIQNPYRPQARENGDKSAENCLFPSSWRIIEGFLKNASRILISDVTIQRFCHDTILRYCKYPRYDTPRYRPSMKQQIIWYNRQYVRCFQELKKENIQSMCSHYKTCQADPG